MQYAEYAIQYVEYVIKYVKQYAEYAKKYVKPFAICRIVTSPDFAYLSYVCTPHFADEPAATQSAEIQFWDFCAYKCITYSVLLNVRISNTVVHWVLCRILS